MMADTYNVIARVVSQTGRCGIGHKVGDEWLISGKTPEGICLSVFNALLPTARTLMFGGSFPWSDDPDVATAACPDAANPVVIELRRVPR
jgi:uncharacterized repeat protein (TIGR04076 family)